MSTLIIGFLATTLPPYHRNFRKRVRKQPRLHFLDTGLVCYLLGIRDPDQLASHPLRGAVFESFVVSELSKAFAHAGADTPLFYWRDARGREIDIVIDLGDPVIPVEVKSGQTVSSQAAETLNWWCKLPDNPAHSGLIVHGGTESFDLNGMRVLPWHLA